MTSRIVAMLILESAGFTMRPLLDYALLLQSLVVNVVESHQVAIIQPIVHVFLFST